MSKLDYRVAKCYLPGMSQPVKLSEPLVLDARKTANFAQRSIAGQVEFWAKLGRAIDPLLQGRQSLLLTRSGEAKPFSQCLEEVDAPEGRSRLADHLASLPYPHFEPAEQKGLLIKIDEDGTRTLGRFINREFCAHEDLAE